MPTRTASQSRVYRDYSRRLLRVTQYIQENLDRPLSLPDLARHACFSPFHFSRFFKGMTGESVRSHIQRLRLERAASHLALGTKPVTTIGLEAGYETHEAFTRAFHRRFGKSPRAYRSQEKPRRGRRPVSKSGSKILDEEASGIPERHQFHEMQVRLVRLPAVRVAYMRHVGPYGKVGRIWEQLCMELGRNGRLGAGETFLGICYDDPEVTQPRQLRYDACISVQEDFQPTESIGVQTVKGGLYAVFTHYGSYRRLAGSYERLLGGWLPRSGYELRPVPCFEVYLNSPENTPTADLITAIHAPLQKWKAATRCRN